MKCLKNSFKARQSCKIGPNATILKPYRRSDFVQLQVDFVLIRLAKFVHDPIALANQRFDRLWIANETLPIVRLLDLLHPVLAQVPFQTGSGSE